MIRHRIERAGPEARPTASARPWIFAGFGNQAGTYRVLLDVILDAIKTGFISYQVVVTFFLPEGSAGESQHLVCQLRGVSFQGSRELGERDLRADEHMYVIGHNCKSVEFVALEVVGVVVDDFHNHVGDGGLAEIEDACAGFI